MRKWNDINIEGISGIDKLVAEFQIWEIASVPSGKFKVKIFENKKGVLKVIQMLESSWIERLSLV